MEAIVALVTCSDTEQARKIATSLVEESLAACVNIISGITSVYSWEGQLNVDSEALLIIKASAQSLAPLHLRVLELHDYTTPEFIVLEPKFIDPRYLAWLLGFAS